MGKDKNKRTLRKTGGSLSSIHPSFYFAFLRTRGRKMPALIEICHANMGYPNHQVLSDIHCQFSRGQCIGVLGSNGAGKSTFLKTLVGVLEPLAGEVVYQDSALRKPLPFSTIGFASQEPMLDWYQTVYENVLLGPLLAGKPLEYSKRLTKEALKRVHLLDKAGAFLDTLSGGQQVRVQIARAVAHQPEIYILDEPTAGLDIETSEEVLSRIRHAVDQGKCALISSHDLALLERFVTHIFFIHEGRLAFFGSLNAFLKNTHQAYQFSLREEVGEELLKQIKQISPVTQSSPHCLRCTFSQNEQLNQVLHLISKQATILDVKAEGQQLRSSYVRQIKRKDS